MSVGNVRAVEQRIFGAGVVERSDVAALRDAMGVHHRKRETASVDRVSASLEAGTLAPAEGEETQALLQLLMDARASSDTPAGTFRQSFGAVVLAPALAGLIAFRGNDGFGVTLAGLVAGAILFVAAAPVTLPIGALYGAAQSLRD